MPHPEQPSYEELAARNAELLAVVAEQAALIESLRAEVAALRRQAGRDSSNSSHPQSQDGPAAKAKTGRREARRARAGRPQGGQKGHPGASLAWAARPDETRVIEPGSCGGCGADLAGAPGRVASSVHVLDIPPAALTVTEYQMMRRECGCGQVTTAPPPPGVTGGPVCYGPGVVDAATPGWLRSERMLENYGVTEDTWREACGKTRVRDLRVTRRCLPSSASDTRA